MAYSIRWITWSAIKENFSLYLLSLILILYKYKILLLGMLIIFLCHFICCHGNEIVFCIATATASILPAMIYMNTYILNKICRFTTETRVMRRIVGPFVIAESPWLVIYLWCVLLYTCVAGSNCYSIGLVSYICGHTSHFLPAHL